MKNIHLLLLLVLPLSTASFSIRPTRRTFGKASVRSGPDTLPPVRRRRNPRGRQRLRALGDGVTARGGGGDGMRILGICGGIGSGKSTACRLMVDSLGCAGRIDADKLAHVVYEPGSKALEEIAEEFGKDVLDDDAQIDRKKLGAIVFNDAESMSKLERIVWPHVREKIEERIKEITHEHQSHDSASNNIIIVEAALLLDTDWHDLLDGLWVIRSSRPVATQRLIEHRGLTEEEASVRIRAQEKRRGMGDSPGGATEGGISDELRGEMERGVVTAVITNDGTLGELQNSLAKALGDSASFKEVDSRCIRSKY